MNKCYTIIQQVRSCFTQRLTIPWRAQHFWRPHEPSWRTTPERVEWPCEMTISVFIKKKNLNTELPMNFLLFVFMRSQHKCIYHYKIKKYTLVLNTLWQLLYQHLLTVTHTHPNVCVYKLFISTGVLGWLPIKLKVKRSGFSPRKACHV